MVKSVENCVEMDADIKLVSVIIFMALFICHCRGNIEFFTDLAEQEYDNNYGQDEIRGIPGEDEKTNQFEWPLDRLRALLGVSMHTDSKRQLDVELNAAAPAPAPAQNYDNNNDNNNNNNHNNNNYNMPFYPLGPSITTPSPPNQSSTPAFNFTAPYPEKEKKGNHKAIAVSVVLTAAVMIILAGMLLYLYRKFIGHHALDDEPKSERPLLASTISDLSESLKALHASVLGSPNGRTESGSFDRGKFENFTLPTNMSKNGTAQTRQVQTLPLSKKPTGLHPLEYSSGDESFHSTCETPSSVPKLPLSHPQQESWQSPSPPSSPASSSSSSPPSPPLFPLKQSASALTDSVNRIHSNFVTKHCPSRSPCPPPPSRPSSRYPSPQPPLTSRSIPSPRHNSIGVPNSREAPMPISSARDFQSSLPPLPPRPPPPLCSSSRGAQHPNHSNSGKPVEQFNIARRDGDPLPKLKPLYWDKVRAPPDSAMVWNRLRSGSFELDEEMIESLFSYPTSNTVKSEAAKCSVNPPPKQHQHILDPRKSQNIAILLRALTVTREEICDALLEGEGLNTEFLETLMKMEPTREEEARLKDYKGDISKLGPAEQFIKALLDIPFAFKRIDAMRFRATFEEEVVDMKKSLETLELACKELRCSRLFLKLLEAVLKTGNRMNVGTFRGEAQAFKLDALLKLADIKGIDGKTTLLHFVVQEIIKSEGMQSAETFKNTNHKVGPAGSGIRSLGDKEDEYKKLGLQLVSGLSTELCNVKKAAGIDSDVLISSLSKLSRELVKLGQFQQIKSQRSTTDENKGNFSKSLTSFLHQAEEKIGQLQKEEERVFLLVKEITEYFHGDSTKEEAHPLRIFVIVRDFLGILDHVCKEIGRWKQNSLSSSNKGFDPISARYSPYSIFPKTMERKPDSSSDKSISA